jgi:hypothetical protein
MRATSSDCTDIGADYALSTAFDAKGSEGRLRAVKGGGQ